MGGEGLGQEGLPLVESKGEDDDALEEGEEGEEEVGQVEDLQPEQLPSLDVVLRNSILRSVGHDRHRQLQGGGCWQRDLEIEIVIDIRL